MEKRVVAQVRQLCRSSTRAETILWRHLRNGGLNGRKWRRQRPIDQYVVDFFCAELRMVVEIDGDVHAFRERQDKHRHAYLKAQGLSVIRFTNADVLHNLEGVLDTLWNLTR